MRILSNTGDERIIDHLHKTQGEIDILTGGFSVFGASAAFARNTGNRLHRLLLGAGASHKELSGAPNDRQRRNALEMRSLCSKLSLLLEGAQMRQAALPPAQSVILGPAVALLGNCELTTAGLGIAPQSSLGFVQETETDDELEHLRQWFRTQWLHADAEGDAVQALMTAVADGAELHPAQSVYLQGLFHLFAEMEEATDENKIVDATTGIRETTVWSKLYRFQKDGVIGAIDKLQRFGGCILADSVGLGKTFEALAVIKYYELRNARVLVLAPKRLRENWTLWTQNDVRNMLAGDRFAFDVLNHTDLSREQGQSGEIDLSHINWGNYNLVVIDESHNFRNRPAGKGERESRYDKLLNAVVKAGVDTKVLMLSATPVNNRLNDLKNQIAFATEGDDRALAGHGVPSIAGTVRIAQGQFNRWQDLPDDRRSPARLLEMLGFDYFRLLDLLTIARSRKHIEKYYGTEETGTFPERLAPKNIYSDVDLSGGFPPIGEVNTEIRRLKLAAFAPLRYVMEDRREAYDRRYSQQTGSGASVFRQLDREESLVALMRVNLLKRMESSVHAFALTIERQLAAVEELIGRIDAHDDSIDAPSIDDLEDDDPEFEQLGVGKNIRVLLSDADLVRWRQDLTEDRDRLASLLRQARRVTPERDAKLADLKALISEKLRAPYNAGNTKLLVFTAFADTAQYLYEQLADEYPRPMALVTGSGRNRTTHPRLRADLGSILTAFSPQSRARPEKLADEPEVDLIIATDCISEGQNLQDCDCVVNYDIHWNPVRIVQRFGRVDRLGSPNDVIQLVNFWPNMDLDSYIGLERSVSGKMMLLDVSATGEENLIEAQAGDRMNDLEYRRRQLESLQDRVIDLEDLSSGVSITDMTLNDLRLDLARLSAEEREAIAQRMIGTYSPIPANDDFPPGALFLLKAATPNAERALAKGDPIFPHALIYVGEDERVILPPSQPKRMLDLLRLAAATPAEEQEQAWAQLNAATRDGSKMEKYQRLLAAAIRGVTGKAEERAVESLFTTGGVEGAGGDSGLDDWEVITWLAVLPPA
ncbi:helicase [Qipengyuania gaetbuli]|uniref:helicase-related protein n=1 Tax=Qipengyuania gaetbuli TaxID=266952 RepID=UPI001C9A1965|nr:helicase-related protein [Qipengyuania gaetbuli]MBY6014704.1 helicase [Qipengyuania gaetbuli]